MLGVYWGFSLEGLGVYSSSLRSECILLRCARGVLGDSPSLRSWGGELNILKFFSILGVGIHMNGYGDKFFGFVKNLPNR